MRHLASMKALLFVPLVLAPYACADDAAERIAIRGAIATLNEPSPPGAHFTGDAYSAFEQLRAANPVAFRIIAPAVQPVLMTRTDDHPTLTISHEPWGEAAIHLPRGEFRPPISFITPDVALAEGAYTYADEHGTRQTAPLLFVMKKEADVWKIASIRVLAQ